MTRPIVLTLLLIAALLAPSSREAQSEVADPLASADGVMVIAHRSADVGGAPENSLSWIAAAIELGVDGVHINPQLTADGHYVLMHDATFNRTTDVERVYPDGAPGGPTRAQRGGLDYVRDYTLDDIGKLGLISATGEPTEGVPSLEAALDLVDGRTLVFLGLKTYDIDSLAAALEGKHTDNLVLFDLYASGTDQSKLRNAAVITGLPVAVHLFRSRDYLGDLERLVAQLGPHLTMVSANSKGITPAFRERLTELGILLRISGANGPEDGALVAQGDTGPWQAALAISDAVSTGLPGPVLELLGR